MSGEITVREAAGLGQSDHGVPLVRKAFRPQVGPLADQTKDVGEQEALSNLFAGALGSYKNPHAHRHAPIDGPRWAIEMILLASHLLYVVDARVEILRALR